MPEFSEQFSGIKHLAASLFLGSQDLMAMYTFYCDDSGTHAESPVAIAACLISTVAKWDRFVSEWCEASRDEQFGVFHMTEFEANQAPFNTPEWRDPTKKKRTRERLISIIRNSIEAGFAIGVMKADYDKTISKTIRNKFHLGKNHYTFAVRALIGFVSEWRKQNHVTQPMNYVFDRMGKGVGEINDQFTAALTGKDAALRDLGVYPGSHTFADRAYIVPLQGADICAWEAYRYAKDILKERPVRVRESYLQLYRPPIKIKWHNQQSLKNLVKLVKEQTWSFGKIDDEENTDAQKRDARKDAGDKS